MLLDIGDGRGISIIRSSDGVAMAIESLGHRPVDAAKPIALTAEKAITLAGSLICAATGGIDVCGAWKATADFAAEWAAGVKRRVGG